jgi:hypothetical protein
VSGFDLPDKDPSVIACQHCFRLTHYSLISDRYVCPACGPVLNSEQLPVVSPPDHTKLNTREEGAR